MKIKEKRLLRGPNLYADSPCLMAVIDDGATNESGKRAGFAARLFALLPELPPDAAVRLADGALVVEALEPVVMELQRLAGAPGSFGATLAVAGQPRARRVVCGYAAEQVAEAALRVAIDLVEALADDRDYDLD